MTKLQNAIIGLAVGDALGVPYEFKTRDTFECTDMIGYGTYNQPAGTWSDDTSMTLATLYSLNKLGKIDLNDIMHQFWRWWYEGKFINSDEVFDVGFTTHKALNNYVMGFDPKDCGSSDIDSNGNGSLMRILPLAFTDCSMEDVAAVSSLTHAHMISVQACQIYVLIARELLKGNSIIESIKNVWYRHDWLSEYNRLSHIGLLNRNEIRSSGYVVDTLEAALWCLAKSSSYEECVLKAVNLGGDTDTVAAVAGGLAGIIYEIPKKWIEKTRILTFFEKM